MLLGDHGVSTRRLDEDDQLLQFAIQQSLIDPGTENEQVTFYEALNRDKTPGGSVHSGLSGYVNIASEEERQLQRYKSYFYKQVYVVFFKGFCNFA